MAPTVIESRLGLRLGTGRWGTKGDIILPEDGEDRHTDALHEGGGANNSIEPGKFAFRGDILPLLLKECKDIRARIRSV